MSPRLRLDLVLNDFVASAIATGSIQILSDGSPWRPLIDVRDMARAIDWAIGRDSTVGGDFLSINVGRNEANYQVRDLAHAVQKLMPGVDVRVNPDAAPDKRSYQVCFDRYAELAPEHLPQVTLEDSIEALKHGLEQLEFADPDFRDSEHVRLRALKGHRDAGRLDDRLRWSRPQT
jgi:nucleoside-diphosphate-sugar epimerase